MLHVDRHVPKVIDYLYGLIDIWTQMNNPTRLDQNYNMGPTTCKEIGVLHMGPHVPNMILI